MPSGPGADSLIGIRRFAANPRKQAFGLISRPFPPTGWPNDSAARFGKHCPELGVIDCAMLARMLTRTSLRHGRVCPGRGKIVSDR
jgi:hypothetical protein